MIDSVYVETRPAPALARHVQCVWYRRVGERDGARPLRVLPDGCMDLMWVPGGLFVAGPDTTAQLSSLPPGAEIIAIRFRPGAATPVLGVPASELIDARVSASEVWGRPARELTARLEAAGGPVDAGRLLQDAVRQRLAAEPPLDHLVRVVVAATQRSDGSSGLRVGQLAARFGISERQLHRRCVDALGYGPKTFARIVRFQHFVELARHTPRTLCDLAAHSGYADQSHLTREVRRMSGVAPAALLVELAR